MVDLTDLTCREQDGNFVEKFTYKWSQKLEDLELQMSAIMPHMATKVTGAGPTSIVSPKPGQLMNHRPRR